MANSYIPIYVMLPESSLGTKMIRRRNWLVIHSVSDQLSQLKDCGVDGVMVDCWWGLVERVEPQDYHWEGYKQLFELVKNKGLKLQVVMSFHSCGGNVGDDVNITLPIWVLEIGNDTEKPDIFFMNEQGEKNEECLSWGIDHVKVLNGRSAAAVYLDYMVSFRNEFSYLLDDGTILEIEIGLGPCGELRYPSYPKSHGWRYPGVGQFQCYDEHLQKSLEDAAIAFEKPRWMEAPNNAGTYKSLPQYTDFFREGGDFDSYRGRFFLSWYASVLVAHGDVILSMAKHIFENIPIAAKVAGIHWFYKTTSHAAELTAGFYNTANRDGYKAVMAMLKKNGVTLNFTCVELQTKKQQEEYPHAMADPEGLVWQVLNDAWDCGLKVAAENALPCYEKKDYEKILINARPLDSPDGRHLCAFTYLRLNTELLEAHLPEFRRFVNELHGN